MNMPITTWIELALYQAQRCHHLAWFVFGCLEHEHVLNVDAFVAWWARGLASPRTRLPLSAAERRTPTLAASVTAPGADKTRRRPAQRLRSNH